MVTDYRRFEDLLLKNGLSGRQGAIMSGVPQSTISNWKAGKREPSLESLVKISAAFGLTVDYFIKK